MLHRRFFRWGFRGRRVAVSGGLLVARSTADPASAAESEQVSFKIFFTVCCPLAHGPMYLVALLCGAPLINVVDSCTIYLMSIRCRNKLSFDYESFTVKTQRKSLKKSTAEVW
jgi:hypothetical protein